MVLSDLQRRKDPLNSLELSGRIKEIAAKLRANREELLCEMMRLKAIHTTSEVKLASSLQHQGGRIEAQCQICKRLHFEVLRAKSALGKAELYSEQANFHYHCSFTTLRRLEASERSLREDPSLAVGETPNPNLIVITDEEIEDWAKELLQCLHADKIREHDAQIAAISWP